MSRFVRWGATHGPVWGVLAALCGGIPLAVLRGSDLGPLEIVLAGAVVGVLAGPVLGATTGLCCLAADRAPKWILDAPDYVAVAVVTALVGGVAWPVLRLGETGLAGSALSISLLACVPAIDAARSAPVLLHPLSMEGAAAVDVAADRQAS
ncbi:MAG: hypothetical protein ICV70_03215 [Jiangellaceae bacterium]|nr:hypothetical protein [Jiangellaceae bacterium]